MGHKGPKKDLKKYKAIFALTLKGIRYDKIAKLFDTDPSVVCRIRSYCMENITQFMDVRNNPDDYCYTIKEVLVPIDKIDLIKMKE